jgi:hypothetical protein
MTLRTAFDRSVAAASWVDEGRDAGVIAVGRALADRMDRADPSDAGASYLAPHLLHIFEALLLTPLARKKAGLADVDVPSEVSAKLRRLRAVNGGNGGDSPKNQRKAPKKRGGAPCAT